MKLAVVALALMLSLLAASPASAQDELISIDSITIMPGGGTTLDAGGERAEHPCARRGRVEHRR